MEELREIGGVDLIYEYEELLKEMVRKPKTFKKRQRLADISDEVLHRVMEFE